MALLGVPGLAALGAAEVIALEVTMRDTPIPWVVALDGTQIIAVQHGCADGRPVNCYLDEHTNWTCPHCLATYGAAFPLAGWQQLASAADAGPPTL